MTEVATSSRQTLEQRRAKHAWETVQAAKRSTEEAAKEFGSQAQKLPTRIMAAGLGQALAFLYAKDYAPMLLTAIADWVLDKRLNRDSTRPQPAKDALLKAIIDGNADFLRRAMDETLAYLRWLNRFAEAEKLTDDVVAQARDGGA